MPACSQLYEVEWQLEQPGEDRQAPRSSPVDLSTSGPGAGLETVVGDTRLLATADRVPGPGLRPRTEVFA